MTTKTKSLLWIALTAIIFAIGIYFYADRPKPLPAQTEQTAVQSSTDLLIKEIRSKINQSLEILKAYEQKLADCEQTKQCTEEEVNKYNSTIIRLDNGIKAFEELIKNHEE